jgi:hypothetical protein
MSDQRGKVLSFGPFDLSIGNRLLTNSAQVVPLGARATKTRLFLALRPPKLSRGSTEHKTEMTR